MSRSGGMKNNPFYFEERHILVVEATDHQLPLIQESCESRKRKYRISFAETIDETYRVIFADPPDIIFIDWMLPDGKGLNLLWDDDLRESFPVVIMICHENEQLEEDIFNSGAVDCLVKSEHLFCHLAYYCEHILNKWKCIQEKIKEDPKIEEFELLVSYEQVAANEEKFRQVLYTLNQSEQMLRISEERLRLCLEASNEGIWDWNIPINMVIMSPYFYTMLGYCTDNIMVIPHSSRMQLFHPDDVNAFKQKLQDCFTRKVERFDNESRLRTKDGGWKWILTKGKVIEWDKEGNPIRMVGTHSDISVRKNIEDELKKKHIELSVSFEQITASEEELRQYIFSLNQSEQMLRVSEERLILAQEMARVGSWEYDLDSGKLWGSAEIFRIHGFSPVSGDIDFDVIETCILEPGKIRLAIDDLIKYDREYNLEYTIYPADGREPRVVHSIGRIDKDNPHIIRGAILDITDPKKKEEALRETNEYLENLISSVNVPIIVWDPSFKITRQNHAFELLTGRPAEDIVGESLEILFPPGNVERSMLLFRKALEGVKLETVEIEIQHKDGSIKTIIWNSSTLYSSDGRTPVATIAQGKDITIQKKLEKERNTVLEQVNQNLAQFAILNDGIRNPLTVIEIIVETIEDSNITDQIFSQTKRIDDMVNQLDKRWIESDKILSFLQKHYNLSFD